MKPLVVLLFTLTLGIFSPSLLAQPEDMDDEPGQSMQGKGMERDSYRDARQKIRNMDRKERMEFFQSSKKKWDALSNEEKEAFKVKVKVQAERQKERMEKRCREMQENPDRIYIRLYSLEQLQQGKQ